MTECTVIPAAAGGKAKLVSVHDFCWSEIGWLGQAISPSQTEIGWLAPRPRFLSLHPVLYENMIKRERNYIIIYTCTTDR